MFDLEQSIAEWRRQMLAAGIQMPVPLEELEIHLREDIERQMKSGENPRPAFEFAAEKIGQPGKLKSEFKKVPVSLEIRLVKLAGIACGVVAGFFSLWISCNLFFVPETNWASRIFALVAITLIFLSWRYGGRFLPAIRRQAIRAAIGFLCCLASFGGMMLFIKSVLPHILNVPAHADFPVNQLFVSFLGAWTAAAILGAIAYRLGDVAGKNNEQHV